MSVVKSCRPGLVAYAPYYYWIVLYYFRDSGAVAVENKKIVGWCLALPVGQKKYFIHQIGVTPRLRDKLIATQLGIYIVHKLKRRGATAIELTIERKHKTSKALFTSIGRKTGLALTRKPNKALMKVSGEDIYTMR